MVMRSNRSNAAVSERIAVSGGEPAEDLDGVVGDAADADLCTDRVSPIRLHPEEREHSIPRGLHRPAGEERVGDRGDGDRGVDGEVGTTPAGSGAGRLTSTLTLPLRTAGSMRATVRRRCRCAYRRGLSVLRNLRRLHLGHLDDGLERFGCGEAREHGAAGNLLSASTGTS